MSKHLCGYCEIGSHKGQIELMPPPHLRRDDGRGICVDVCLAIEISNLWRMGISTTGCCCGHGKVEPYIGVADADIPKMIAMGYKICPNETDPTREDGFYPKSISTTVPCDELVTVAYQFRDDWIVSDAPKVMRKDDYELRELVTRQYAEGVIAAEREEKLEAAWLEAEGIISDLKAELAEALRGNRYAQLERIAVQRAEKAEADNAVKDKLIQSLIDFDSDEVKRLEADSAAKDARIAELEAKLETANALVTCCCGSLVNDHDMGSGHSPVDQYHYAMVQLEADNKRLREALEPFADVADLDIGDDEDDMAVFWPISNERFSLARRLRVGDLRRASEALEEVKP